MGTKINTLEECDLADLRPIIAQMTIPAVPIQMVEQWHRLNPKNQKKQICILKDQILENTSDNVQEHPWWPVLANLSVGPLDLYDEDWEIYVSH